MIGITPPEQASALCLGEVMMRLDPGQNRIRHARSFDIWEGGGEYNVGRALSSVFGHRVGIITALVDNEVGRLIEGMIKRTGISTSYLTWFPSDGLGRASRNGLNFTERGFGLRAPIGISDRGHSAASQFLMKDEEWDAVFESFRPNLLHTGGIYAALSENSHLNTLRAIAAAKRHGVTVTYDFNHRPSLWTSGHRPDTVREKTSAIIEHVDVLIGGEFDLNTSLGMNVSPASNDDHLSLDSYNSAAEAAAELYPNLQAMIGTRRRNHSSTNQDLAAVGWSRSAGLQKSRTYSGVEIYDRVGAGDAFAAGWLYGHFNGQPFEDCLEWGIASSALAMTTPGDSLSVTSAEVRGLVEGRTTAMQR